MISCGYPNHQPLDGSWLTRALGDESPLLPLPIPLSPPLPSFTVPLFFANDICIAGIKKSVTATLADVNEKFIVRTKSITTKPLLLVILIMAILGQYIT